MSLIRHPFFDETMPSRFNSMFDRFMQETMGNFYRPSNFVPSCDLVEEEKQWNLHVAVPGMKKDDFKVEINGNLLTVSGERKMEQEDKGQTYHKMETYYGKFSRTFTLPENVKRDAIEAQYNDGILQLVLPKDEQQSSASQIKIK